MAGVRVLIVEDEYITSTALKDALEDMGYVAIGVATTEDEAMTIARKEKPDLILMDIVLKAGSSGISAAGKIREELNIPVIYLTAHSSPDLLSQAKTTEPFGYIVKPYTNKEIRANIEVALYKHEMEQKLKEAHSKIKILHGLLPICACCKKIRNDEGYWEQVEVYIRDRSEAKFTHGYCPECAKKLLEDFEKGK